MKRRKWVSRGVMAVLALVAVAAGARYWNGREAASEASPAPITVAEVKRGSLRQEVNCTGRVVSNLDVEIKCRASGQIVKLPFDVSDTVKEGDLLLELDPVDQERQVQQAEAALAASQARLEQARSTLAVAQKSLVADRLRAQAAVSAAEARARDAEAKAKREEQLMEKKYSSIEGVETAQTAAEQAKQDLKTAQAQLEMLEAMELDLETKRQQIKLAEAEVQSDHIALTLSKRQLGYTRVYAPIDGVVSARNVQIGQIIASGINNVGGGTTVMVLSDVSRIFVLASVDESDIGDVQIGQPVEITADAYPREQFRGKVERIAAKGVNLQNVVTFEVRVEVEGEKKSLLKPEMTTNVSIVVADKKDILTVPYNAIARERGETYVMLAKADGSAGDKKPVEIGITDGNEIEIVSGLNEGEKIAVQSPEAESRWRSEGGGGGGSSSGRQRMMMMRTMGGGGPRR